MAEARRGPGQGRFLGPEEDRRGAQSGRMVNPRPRFVQPDNGAQTDTGEKLDATSDPTKRRMKSWNVTTDLNGGLY